MFNARFPSLLLFIASLTLSATTFGQTSQAGLENVLLKSYQRWRTAMVNQDAAAWAAAIPKYRQVVTRNLIVSQRQPFPSAVFAVPLDPPDVAGLRLIQVKAVGPTAHLLYFGKVNIGGDPAKIPDNLLMLKFIEDNGEWRFDSNKMMNLEGSPEVRAALQKGSTPDLLSGPQFTPPGVVPPTPALCQPPENMAGCTLQAYGYDVRMNINGFDYPVTADRAEKMFVTGGLSSGRNDVRLTIKPTQATENAERVLQLDFFVFTGQKDKPSIRVFHYESKDPNLPASLSLPVLIDQQILKEGR